MANIVQRTQYYPFGLPFADAQGRDLQPYTYNGKENDSRLQLNLMDYEARLYNPQYAGWPTMDPLAEKYYSWSPYAYVANNPLRFIDVDGREKLIGFQEGNIEYRHEQEYRDDSAIHIFGHSSPTRIEVYNFIDGKRAYISDSEGLQKYLKKISEVWKSNEDRDEGQSFTIVLHTCRSGYEDESENSLAKRISNSPEFENDVIIAPDKYHAMKSNSDIFKDSYYGIYGKDNPKDKQINQEKGSWNVYKAGDKVAQISGEDRPTTINNGEDLMKLLQFIIDKFSAQ